MLNIHDILINEARKLESGKVAVLLSAGIDSASVLFSLQEIGRYVKAYSFHLDGVYSRDFIRAKSIANRFGVEFEEIILPKDVATLKTDVIRMAKLGCRKKTEFECLFPMLYAFEQIAEPIIASGIPADGYFCLSKSGMMHHKNNLDAFRNSYFSNPNAGQRKLRLRLAKVYKKKLFDPYYSTELFSYFQGKTWDELNKPNQKQPILNAFPEQYKQMKIYPHTNLQKGDSGIAEAFEALLKSDLNRNGYKSITGVYNDVVRRFTNAR